MRRTWVAVGVAALLLGAFVSFVPIIPIPSGTRTVGGITVAYFQVHSLVIPQYLQVPWTASTTTSVFAVDCGAQEPVGIPSGGNGTSGACSPSRVVAQQQGTSGTLSFSASDGDWIYIGASGGNASITLRTTNGLVGFVVMVMGALIALAGLFLGGGAASKSAPPPEERTPEREEPASEPAWSEATEEEGNTPTSTEGPEDQDDGEEPSEAAPRAADAEDPAKAEGTS